MTRHKRLLYTLGVLLALMAGAVSARPAWPWPRDRLAIAPHAAQTAQTRAPALTAAPERPTLLSPTTGTSSSQMRPLALPSPSPTPTFLERLRQQPMPPRDDLTLVSQLRGGQPIPPIVRNTSPQPSIGDQRRFWIGDMDFFQMREITATLRVLTDHVQMWVQNEATVDQEALERSARVFAEHIYPTMRHYFGLAWALGIDDDLTLVVLNALLSGAAGYFSRTNQYPRAVNPYSNECEMIVMNVGHLTPGTPPYESVLAHEFQHLLHWHLDSNEETWVNEGASELAEELNGFSQGRPAVRHFAQQPDTQLNAWPASGNALGPHYGAAYLIMRYFFDRFGPEMLRALIHHPASGIAGFDAVLAQHGKGMTFDDLFADWVVANALDDPTLADGRYGYPNMDIGMSITARTAQYPFTRTAEIHQYAAHYYEALPNADGMLRITFRGTPTVRLVPNEPTSGQFQWWSNRGDGGHATLEHLFDLTQVITATLRFNLWYDIEEGWDYAYVRASTDGGRTWAWLRGQHMTDENPTGNALGPGYTGRSGRPTGEPIWVREEIDLGAYVGQHVLVRFDYLTDDAVNLPGLCLDDFELEAIGFADDVEAGAGRWQARGFIRHENILPQRYIVQAVTFGEEVGILRLPLNEGAQGEWLIEGFGREVERVLLIIAAMTPATTERAAYEPTLEYLPQASQQGRLFSGQHRAQIEHHALVLHASDHGG